MTKLNPWTYIRSINEAGEPLDDLSAYSPFIVNRALGSFPDTLPYVQELNKRPDIPDELQYLFLFHVVVKRKRYAEWKRERKDEYIEELQELYPQYSKNKIEEFLMFVDEDTIKNILKSKGGKE